MPNISEKNEEIPKKINNESAVLEPKKIQEDPKEIEKKNEQKIEILAEEKIVSPEEMMKLMGFAGFNSTKVFFFFLKKKPSNLFFNK